MALPYIRPQIVFYVCFHFYRKMYLSDVIASSDLEGEGPCLAVSCSSSLLSWAWRFANGPTLGQVRIGPQGLSRHLCRVWATLACGLPVVLSLAALEKRRPW